MQEEDLIQLLIQQDPKGAEELLRHYGPLMQYVIRPIVADPQDREECLSESVLRILDKIHLYDSNRGSWSGWVTAVTRSVALNKLRQTNTPAEEVSPDTPSPDPTPEEQMLRNERRKELQEALSQLSQGDRLIFYRKYYYLQSTAQIASEIGLTERAVEGRLYRIKKRLRKLLGGDGNG